MNEPSRYSFVAVDPEGVPRTGKIKASDPATAESRLRARGFSAIEIRSADAQEVRLEVKTTSSTFRTGRAEKRGYSAGPLEKWQEFSKRLPDSKVWIGLILIFGVFATVYFWSPVNRSETVDKKQEAQLFDLEVSATLDPPISGGQLVIEFPEIPYAWDTELLEGSEPQTVERRFQLKVAQHPTFVRLTVFENNSGNKVHTTQRSVSEGLRSLNFENVTVRAD